MNEKKYFAITTIFSNAIYAEVGVVRRGVGSDAIILRDEKTVSIFQDMVLEEGDRIETNNSIVLLQIYPGTQINLSEKSVFSIEEHEVDLEQNNESSNILMAFLRGKLKILVEKLRSDDTTSQTIRTNSVALAVRGTQFEVEENSEGTNVDVTEGVVAASIKGDNVDLKKDDSLQVSRHGSRQLRDGLRKRMKLINHNWQFPFLDSETIKARWRERRIVFKNDYFKLDPEARKKLREEKRLKREARRKKWQGLSNTTESAPNERREERLEKIKERLKKRIR